MKSGGDFLRPIFSRTALLAAIVMAMALTVAAGAAHARDLTLRGQVKSNDVGLPNYQVSLYGAFIGGHGRDWRRLGSATTNAAGDFRVVYAVPDVPPRQPQPLLFVEAKRGASMLASAIGNAADAPTSVVVNERTTVATGNAFAQFVGATRIEGNTYGMANAVRMAGNFADPKTGEVGLVLNSSPNRTETSTLATFNSLANVVASCVADAESCAKLFKAATPAGEPAPANVLEALANIVKNPSYVGPDDAPAADDPLFDLSLLRRIYQPVLQRPPTNWLLFLKLTGGFYSAQDSHNLMSGPGNFAIDAHGFVWLDTNYKPQPPSHFACASRRLIKLYPWGKDFKGSPYFGGGLSGQGWGITFDPNGNLWVGNFGFQDPPCAFLPQAAANDSVSLFRPDGTAVSPSGGFTKGSISWPQGTVSDRRGNIWVANCGNDSVTKIPGGNSYRAFHIPLGATPAPGQPQIKPFGLALDLDGNIWATNNFSATVSVISPRGRLIDTLPRTYRDKTVLSHPVGDAADSRGNIWVANSDWLDVPCPTRRNLGPAKNPSITMYRMRDRTPYPGSPFTGGGLTLPWGITVDGNDTVWVFNFGVTPVSPDQSSTPTGNQSSTPTGISHFCGIDSRKCPAGMRTGDAISPSTGYRSDAIQRITAGQIDPSGNIWITNNWKIDANPFKNPGGNAIVIAVGAAAPIRTPLIGPPVPFD